jgi:hypothetical protein
MLQSKLPCNMFKPKLFQLMSDEKECRYEKVTLRQVKIQYAAIRRDGLALEERKMQAQYGKVVIAPEMSSQS